MDLYLAAFILLTFMVFTFKKWALQGQLFHPGFIYVLVNGGLFLIFALGPYRYNYPLAPSYYYMYVLITCVFGVGTKLGELKGKKKSVLSINSLINNKSYLWYFILIGMYGGLLFPLILSGGFSSEQIAENYENEVNAGRSSFDIINFIILNFTTSLLQIGTAILISHAIIKPKKYSPRIIVIVGFSILSSLLSGSRTRLVLFLIPIIVPIYITYQGKINLSKNKHFKKIMAGIIFATLGVFLAITNARSMSSSLPGYVIIEQFCSVLGIERQPWFDTITEKLPETIVNTISLISIYSGSTVIHGGIVSNIVLEKGIYAFGLRSFFPIHRILSQLGLDFGFSELCRENLYKMQELASRETPSILSGWYGDPGNMIFDFGYIGASLVSLITGYAIGWMYGRIFHSGSILKSTGCSLIAISLILTPSAGAFSFFSNFMNLSLLGFHLIKNSQTQLQRIKRFRINHGKIK